MSAETTRTFEEQLRRMMPVAAPPEQRSEVAALFRLLDQVADARSAQRGCTLVGPSGDEIQIPESVFYVLERVAEVLARGDSITVVPVGQELTTQQAADILNVSRQYLVRLLDDKQIPFSKVGKHRRVRIEDILDFKKKRDGNRRAALDELSRASQDFGGYEELK